jgi:hypothetical protein
METSGCELLREQLGAAPTVRVQFWQMIVDVR